MWSIVGIALLAQLGSTQEILSRWEARVSELGTYRIRTTKQERVKGEKLPKQTMELVIRSEPFAVHAVIIAGPPKGRRFVYDEEKKPNHLLVREKGIAALAGTITISITSPLTRRDTNHSPASLGHMRVLAMIRKDHENAAQYGGYVREDLENDCVRFTAPDGAKGLYAKGAVLCFESDGLLKSIEVDDEKGFLERLEYELIDEKIDSYDFSKP